MYFLGATGRGTQHRLLWDDGTADFWQSAHHTLEFSMDSAEYVGKQVQVNPFPLRRRSGRSWLGVVASVTGSVLEIMRADGTRTHLNTATNTTERAMETQTGHPAHPALQSYSVEWLLDFDSVRWLNDSHVAWAECGLQVRTARAEWLRHGKELFPLQSEAEAVLQALVSHSVLDVQADADVLECIRLRRFEAIKAQQGSLIKDAVTVLETLANWEAK